MANTKKDDAAKTEAQQEAAPQGAGANPQAAGATVRIELLDENVDALYANLCRVSSTPEEVILDLALNPNPLGGQVQRLRVSQRVILNHFTAKRLAALLTATVQRHEQVFGRLETDVRKRLQGVAEPQTTQTTEE